MASELKRTYNINCGLDILVKDFIEEKLQPAHLESIKQVNFHLIADEESFSLISKVALIAIETFKLTLEVFTKEQTERILSARAQSKSSSEPPTLTNDKFRDLMRAMVKVSLPDGSKKRAIESAIRGQIENRLLKDYKQTVYRVHLEVGNTPYFVKVKCRDVVPKYELNHLISSRDEIRANTSSFAARISDNLDVFPELRVKSSDLPSPREEEKASFEDPDAYLVLKIGQYNYRKIQYSLGALVLRTLKSVGKQVLSIDELLKCIRKKHEQTMHKVALSEYKRLDHFFRRESTDEIIHLSIDHKPNQKTKDNHLIVNILSISPARDNILRSLINLQGVRLDSWKKNLATI